MRTAEPGGFGRGSSRSTPLVLLLVAGVLLVARVGLGVYEGVRAGAAVPERVRWRALERAEAESKRTRKPILYDFTAEWCGPCQRLSREVFADPRAAAELERVFVPVRVLDRKVEEGSNSPRVDSLMVQYRVSSFPTLVAAIPGGRHVVAQVGYPGPRETLRRLVKAGESLGAQMRREVTNDSTTAPVTVASARARIVE